MDSNDRERATEAREELSKMVRFVEIFFPLYALFLGCKKAILLLDSLSNIIGIYGFLGQIYLGERQEHKKILP